MYGPNSASYYCKYFSRERFDQGYRWWIFYLVVVVAVKTERGRRFRSDMSTRAAMPAALLLLDEEQPVVGAPVGDVEGSSVERPRRSENQPGRRLICIVHVLHTAAPVSR